MSAIRISISELNNPDLRATLVEKIEQGMGSGSDALGLVLIEGVEGLKEARQELLAYGHRIAALSDEERTKMEAPETLYNSGWSFGKEVFNGSPDFAKGSFYANPVYDEPSSDVELIKKYPFYFGANIWPKESLPGLEQAFKKLGGLVIETGKLLAKSLDDFVASKISEYPPNFLHTTIDNTRIVKGRLLHYFPRKIVEERYKIGNGEDDWCGWHLDHCALTGLTSAMFLDENGQVVANPDPEAGLYVRNRGGNLVKVSIPEDCLAFQLGEWMQIASGGVLRATPHCVKAPKENKTLISRNTLAIFMQPNYDEVAFYPKTVSISEFQVKGWKPEQTFAQFSQVKFEEYY